MANGKSEILAWGWYKEEPSKKKGLTMEHMLSKALREFFSGPLNQLIVNLGGESGEEWEAELKKFLRKETCWPGAEITQAVIDDPDNTKPPVNLTYPIPIDYGMGIEELVRLGGYNWSNNDITSKHFPTKRTGKAEVSVELIHFNRAISSEEAIREMDKMGYRPAEACELLAFGAKYPDVQREFPIFALGSVWRVLDGVRSVVCLLRGGDLRDANLYWFVNSWFDDCRFAAVRK